MKTRLTLLCLVALACLVQPAVASTFRSTLLRSWTLGRPSALGHARTQNSGTINAADVSGYNGAPPPFTSPFPWTSGSYVQLNLPQIGVPQTLTITVGGASLIATLHVYYTTDGTSLFQVPDAAIWCNETRTYGAIAASTQASYTCNIPGATTAWVKCTAYTSGPTLVSLANASINPTMPGATSDPALPVVVNPLSLALADIGGSGDTIGVEFLDSAGVTIPLLDTAGVGWSAVTVTLSASAKSGLSYLLLHTSPDSTHPITGLPSVAVGVRLRCMSGTSGIPTLAINTGGLASGAAGTGMTGYNTGFAPNSSSPIQYFVLDAGSYGRIR